MSVTSVSSTSTTATPSSDMISSRSASMDKADFLQMLTAQLKQQDPMNPQDSSDFATQLATFSSVQELQTMSETMDQTLQANLLLGQTFSNTMSTSLIGKYVHADVDSVTAEDSGTVQLAYNLPSAATEVTVEIKDSDGNVIRTLNINAQSAGDQQLTWDGLDSDGTHVAAGTYTLSVTGTDGNGQSITGTTFVDGLVSAIQYTDGNAVLLVNGMTVQLGQVVSIRDSEG
jgi:flagellar basal-body rod modification protein FlgD